MALLLFDSSGQHLILSAFESGYDHPAIEVGTEIRYAHGGAAERLGLKRTTLQNKMRRLGIGKGDYQTHR